MIGERLIVDTVYLHEPETGAYRVEGVCPFPDMARPATAKEKRQWSQNDWEAFAVHEHAEPKW